MAIAIIEDDEAVLHSLQLLLEARGMDVTCHTSAEAFLASIDAHLPACVVSDVRMPGMSGVELQHELKRRSLSVPIILITGHGDIAMAVAAVKAGAADFIEKPFDDEQLVASISAAVSSGEAHRIEAARKAELEERLAELSPRQREVMQLVAEGLSNKEIAGRLGISPRTVENYRAWVMERMGATNVADLVRMVMQLEPHSH